MFPRLLWSWFLVDLWLWWGRFSIAKGKALKLVWNQFCPILCPHPQFMSFVKITLEENSWKQKKLWLNMSKYQRRMFGVLESAVQGSDFKREIIYAVFWPSECLHFSLMTPLWTVCLTEEKQTGPLSDFLPESPAELPDSDDRFMMKVVGELSLFFFFFLISWFMGIFFGKMDSSGLMRVRGFHTVPWKGVH